VETNVTTKKIVPARATRQAKALAEWSATLTPEQRASIQPGALRGSNLEPEAERQRRKQDDREREKHRTRRRVTERPSRKLKETNRDLWEGYLASSVSGYSEGVTPRHLVMLFRMAALLDEIDPDRQGLALLGPTNALQKKVPSQALKRLELGYVAAFPLEYEWQGVLHHSVKWALSLRTPAPLSKRLDPARPGRKSGEHVVRELRLLFPGVVPAGLTGAKVEKILQTATKGAGGGPKRAKNVRTAVNELIGSLGCELFEPVPPPGQTRR
jgi:hypothetical protein